MELSLHLYTKPKVVFGAVMIYFDICHIGTVNTVSIKEPYTIVKDVMQYGATEGRNVGLNEPQIFPIDENKCY